MAHGHYDSKIISFDLVCINKKHRCGSCNHTSNRQVCRDDSCDSGQVVDQEVCWSCFEDSWEPPTIDDYKRRERGIQMCDCEGSVLDFSRRWSFLERKLDAQKMPSLPKAPKVSDVKLTQSKEMKYLCRFLGSNVAGLVVHFIHGPAPTAQDLRLVCECQLPDWEHLHNFIDSTWILDSPIVSSIDSPVAYVLSGNDTFRLERRDGRGLTHGDVFSYFRQMSDGDIKWVGGVPIVTVVECPEASVYKKYYYNTHLRTMDPATASSDDMARVIDGAFELDHYRQERMFKFLGEHFSLIEGLMTPRLRNSILSACLVGIERLSYNDKFPRLFELAVGGFVDSTLLLRAAEKSRSKDFDGVFARVIESATTLTQSMRWTLSGIGPLSAMAIERVLDRRGGFVGQRETRFRSRRRRCK